MFSSRPRSKSFIPTAPIRHLSKCLHLSERLDGQSAARPFSRRRNRCCQAAYRRRARPRLLWPERRSAGGRAAAHGRRSAARNGNCRLPHRARRGRTCAQLAQCVSHARSSERRLSRSAGQSATLRAFVAQGERRDASFVDSARSIFAREPGLRIDYIALVDWVTLEPVETAVPGSLFAVAAWVGSTRLIDNTILR